MEKDNKVAEINMVFLLTICVYIVGSTVLSELKTVVEIDEFILILVSQGMLILPTIGYVLYNKINIFKLIRLKKINLTNVFLLVGFSLLIMPIMNLINVISMLFAADSTTVKITGIVGSYPLIVSLVGIALIPAILEETVYRGVFYNEYRKVNVRKGVLLSGFLFGLLHMNINQFSYAFFMGIVFAFLIEATDSILSSMIVHFIINAYSILTVSFLPKILKMMETSKDGEKVQEIMNVADMPKEQIVLLIISLAKIAAITTPIACLFYFAIAKAAGRWEMVKHILIKNDREHSMKSRLITPSLGVAITVCIVLMIMIEVA